ncbi:MAG: hypothetical protein JWO36_2975 [Myxococcales bacterium]|nr:hypothetical protein [Myxococcales bacterium]
MVYRPRVGKTQVHGIRDVQRLWMILSPHGGGLHRRIVIGRKRLPETGSHERHWAFVDRVARDPVALTDDLRETEYATRTRGIRHQAAARAAAEGVYAIAEHDDHAHLAYRLELPEEPGDAQRELGIHREASYIAAVFNPYKPWRQPLPYPTELQAKFGDRRFVALEPAFLDFAGTELVLIGATDDISAELGITLDVDREVADTFDLFRELAHDGGEHPMRPLFEGLWS